MSRVHDIRDPNLPDGELTGDVIDEILQKTKCKVTPSAIANIELARVCTTELYMGGADILADLEQVWNDADHYSGEDFLQSLSDAFSTHAPTFASAIDIGLKEPSIFICKNDEVNSNLGSLKLPKDKLVGEVAELQPKNPLDSHPGVAFYPRRIDTQRKTPSNNGSPKLISNFTYAPKHAFPPTNGSRLIEVANVSQRDHKHPLKYALQFFSSTVFNLYHVAGAYKRVVGTVAEALRVLQFNSLFVDAYWDEDLDDVAKAHPDTYARWKTKCGIFDFDKYHGVETIVFCTSRHDILLAAREADPFDTTIYYYPAADTIRLIKDNANRALLYNTPKWDKDAVVLNLWDRRHCVASYKLAATPFGSHYSLLSYQAAYARHPMNLRKKKLNQDESSTLHFLKIAVHGAPKGVCVPYAVAPDLFQQNCGPNVRCIPGFTPIVLDRIYTEWEGHPILAHFQLRQQDVVLNLTDLVSRATGIHRASSKTKSGILDFVAIAFKTGPSLTLAKVITSSVGFDGANVPQYAADVAGAFGFISTLGGGRRVIGSKNFAKKNWYVAEDGHFASLKTPPKKDTDPVKPSNIGLPLSNVSTQGEIKYYFDPGFELSDLQMTLGILEVEVMPASVHYPAVAQPML